MRYIGRFAPSPTGPLHFGSLLAALASYLDARAHHGDWLLRIEDTDPPREPPDAKDAILRALDAFGLHWDGPVRYQSSHHHDYQALADQLVAQGDAYPCACSRKQIEARTGSRRYDEYCRQHPPAADQLTALRVHCPQQQLSIEDRIQGHQAFTLPDDGGDFIIVRKDHLFAYQLAVVADDADQGITHIVRGYDLLSETPRQLRLQQVLSYPQPEYAHIPVATHSNGQKLSKQNHAPALDLSRPVPQILQALAFLGQPLDPAAADASVTEVLEAAVAQWQIANVPHLAELEWHP